MTNALFDVLPGIVMPVAQVAPALAHMWEGELEGRAGAPSEFHAIQMNLVLHFGLKTTPEEAAGLFEVAVKFAQRYPSRIVCLCPTEEPEAGPMQGKLYSQCFVGTRHRQMCCCEGLILGYPVEEVGYLEHQVSVWLEADLPTYHWLHRVPASRIQQNHLGFLRQTRRVLYDSEIAERAYGDVDWPAPDHLRDLAVARALPARQSLGGFLSGVEPRDLVSGLQEVQVHHGEGWGASARHLAHWMVGQLRRCADVDERPLPGFAVKVERNEPTDGITLEVRWRYAGGKHLRWYCCDRSQTGAVEADFGHGRISQPLHLRQLEPQEVLSEALFF